MSATGTRRMSPSGKSDEAPTGVARRPGLLAWRFLLALAMIDALAWGVVWGLKPNLLFDRLGMQPRHDSWAWQLLVRRGDSPDRILAPRDAGLWQALAFLSVAQAGFLALAAWRPRSLGGLVIVPL